MIEWASPASSPSSAPRANGDCEQDAGTGGHFALDAGTER
jgi:hypothetical protein